MAASTFGNAAGLLLSGQVGNLGREGMDERGGQGQDGGEVRVMGVGILAVDMLSFATARRAVRGCRHRPSIPEIMGCRCRASACLTGRIKPAGATANDRDHRLVLLLIVLLGSSGVDLALVDIERKYGDTIFPLILNNDHTDLTCIDLPLSPLRFLYCLNVVSQFNAYLINYGHLTTSNMKVVARHLVRPPHRRSSLRNSKDEGGITLRRCPRRPLIATVGARSRRARGAYT